MIEVLNWRRKLLQATQSSDIELLDAVVKEERSVTDRLDKTLRQRELLMEISKADFGQPISDKTMDQLTELGDGELSYHARIQYFNSLYHTYIVSANSKAAESTLMDMLSYFNENEHLAKNDPGLYISSLNNAIAYYVFNKNIPKAKELIRSTIQKCDDWGVTGRNKIAFRQLLRTFSIELEIYRDTVEEEKDDSIVRQIENLMEESEEAINEEYQILYRFQLASIYFRSKNYSRSLFWINEHLNKRVQPIRMELEVYIRILNLLIHFELGNLFVLGYSIDSTRRFIKKHNASEAWINELLRTFGKVRNSPSSEITDIFERLYLKLFPSGKLSLVSDDTLDLINIKNWLYSKVYYPSSVRVS